jgi:hypothetical protein
MKRIEVTEWVSTAGNVLLRGPADGKGRFTVVVAIADRGDLLELYNAIEDALCLAEPVQPQTEGGAA